MNRTQLLGSFGVFLATVGVTSPALAGEAATLVFKEGQVVRTNYGFTEISNTFRGLGKEGSRQIIELKLEGGVFLLNISEVVIVCRDDCPGLTVEDPRKSSKDSR